MDSFILRMHLEIYIDVLVPFAEKQWLFIDLHSRYPERNRGASGYH